MTFHPLMGRAVKALDHSGSVCEFGNQRYTADGKHKSVKEFYLANGYDNYIALDVNTQKDAIICDLNVHVSHQGITNQYDLVTNNGTGEHIFNQYMVFRNHHDLTKEGGIMLFCLPLSPWINHGFFNYNPILFRDLSAINDYEVIYFWVGNRWGNYRTLPEDLLYKEKRPQELINIIHAISSKGDAFCTVAMRKINNNEFNMPVQGKYQKDIESDELKRIYQPTAKEA